ncbi:MAG TPA: hypothetical protein VGD98_06140 [Ktedonobacteraceae bacterium]
MALICPQCSQVKQDASLFCRGCGYRFQGNEQDEAATIRPASMANVPNNADPSDTLKSGQPFVAQPTPAMVTPQPQGPGGSGYIPVFEQPAPSPFFAQPAPSAPGGYPPQQAMYGQQYAPQGAYGAPAPMPMAPPAGPSAVESLQRAFAGKGTPVHHQSWLIDSKQVASQGLTGGFINNLQKQNVQNMIIETERLREHGMVLEVRDYIKVRYNTASVFVYMAPMGQNLYISRTSTIQQPYSKVRIAVLIALAVLMLISVLLYAVINPTYDPLNVGAFGFVDTLKSFFFYAFFGLLFFFVIALLRSVVFFLTDKDFLAVLRPNRLNDFSLDALSLIEQTTDKALRLTLQEAGLDADVIQLAHSTTPQLALRRI